VKVYPPGGERANVKKQPEALRKHVRSGLGRFRSVLVWSGAPPCGLYRLDGTAIVLRSCSLARHSHGGSAFASAHSPRFAARADCSAAANVCEPARGRRTLGFRHASLGGLANPQNRTVFSLFGLCLLLPHRFVGCSGNQPLSFNCFFAVGHIPLNDFLD